MNVSALTGSRRAGKLNDTRINMSHGSGGRAMRALIEDVFVAAFDNPLLSALEDQAQISLADLTRHGDRLAFTTDTYVVDPLFFPGGDIGTLAVAGTVNDLAMSGARPFFLSCSVVLEEGLDVDVLRRVVASMKRSADQAGVAIVTGDTKVVERGAADKLFVNTAGIGVVPRGVDDLGRPGAPGRCRHRQRRPRRPWHRDPDRAQSAGTGSRCGQRLPAARRSGRGDAGDLPRDPLSPRRDARRCRDGAERVRAGLQRRHPHP